MKPITRQLADKLGGKWSFNRASGCSWDCEDGRNVSRRHTGGYDVSGEALPGYGYFTNDGERVYLQDRHQFSGGKGND